VAKIEGLQIEQDLEFQRREWRVQHVGWWFLTAFVLAAAAGLFGGGPLSHARAGDPSRLQAEYERFTRVGAHTRILLRGRADPGQPLDVAFERTYFEGFRVDRVVPEPESVRFGGADVTLRFRPDVIQDGGYTVILDLEPLVGGARHASIKAAGAATLTYRQFAYF
jgi:hypothetical protein